jgi:PAS domain S-box-containing protein
VLYIGRDITQSKLAERAQRDSEEQYRAIFDASADALVLRDAAYRAVGVNPAYLSMSGYTREEVMAADGVLTLGDPVLRERLRADHRLALAGRELRFEMSATRKDGSVLEAEVQGTPMTYRGQPHVLYAVRDITARVAAEQRRIELERQLRQAQKMEAIGQLTGGLAHDFNNILTSVLGYIDMAQERPASVHDRCWRATCPRRAGRRACARARGAGCWRSPAAPRRTPAAGAGAGDGGRAAAAAAEPALVDHRRLRCERPGRTSASPVLADPVQFEQVLLNLCINARDAIGEHGTIRLRIVHARPGATAPRAARGWRASAGSASRWPTTAAA